MPQLVGLSGALCALIAVNCHLCPSLPCPGLHPHLGPAPPPHGSSILQPCPRDRPGLPPAGLPQVPLPCVEMGFLPLLWLLPVALHCPSPRAAQVSALPAIPSELTDFQENSTWTSKTLTAETPARSTSALGRLPAALVDSQTLSLTGGC